MALRVEYFLHCIARQIEYLLLKTMVLYPLASGRHSRQRLAPTLYPYREYGIQYVVNSPTAASALIEHNSILSQLAAMP